MTYDPDAPILPPYWLIALFALLFALATVWLALFAPEVPQ
jgi:hypothetical protein